MQSTRLTSQFMKECAFQCLKMCVFYMRSLREDEKLQFNLFQLFDKYLKCLINSFIKRKSTA